MSAKPEIRAQLETLRIAEGQRPSSDRATTRRRSRTGRLFAVLVVLALIGAGAVYAVRAGWGADLMSAAAPAAEVPLFTVTAPNQGGPQPVLTATGKIVSDHRVLVSTKVSGQIVDLLFEQGDRVEKGQPLAQLEDVNYRARRDEAAAKLEKARANLAFQEINNARVESLHRSGLTSGEIEMAEARRGLSEGKAQVSAEEAALVWAQKALDDCRVVAPIAGVILERNVEIGDFVAAEGGRGANANAQFAAIADMSMLRVEVDVSELDITRLKKDMACTITPEAYKDRRYPGKIMWLDPGANYSKATVQVKVRIESPDEFLRVEGSAKVEFLPSTRESDTATSQPASRGLWIPTSACITGADGKSGRVYCVVENRLVERVVALGSRLSDQVEVLQGIAPGDRIAARNLDQVANGQRIRPPAAK